MTPEPHPALRRWCAAFTLVETMLAVAIAGSVILILVSLIPGGMEQMERASSATAEARILQSVAGEFQMRAWQDILQLEAQEAAEEFHFDAQGARVSSDDAWRHFVVRARVAAAPSLPGAATASPALRQVTIWITDHPDSNRGFEQSGLHRRRHFILSQTDKSPGVSPGKQG